MPTCCCVLCDNDAPIDRQVLSRLLKQLSPEHSDPKFSGTSEVGFGLYWLDQFFVITQKRRPVPINQLQLMATADLTEEIQRHRSHWIACHVEGSGERLFQAHIFTLLLSALSTFGVAVMWRDHTLLSSADWQACTHNGMDLSQWITVLRTDSAGGEWIRTYGLDFFGRPEIALKIGSNTVDITIDYLKSFADFLLENAIEFAETKRIVGQPMSFDVERVTVSDGMAELVYLSTAK